jgi:hypothetical protein
MDDNTAAGWLITIGYSAAAACAGAAASAPLQSDAPSRDRALWLVICLTTIALSINKQLDLQSHLTAFGREMAQSDGWYAERRWVQAAFVFGISLSGATLLATLLLKARASALSLKFALFGLVVLGLFTMIRAVSIHHVDQLLRLEVAGTRWTFALEIGGAALILVAGIAYFRQSRKTETRNGITPLK